MAKRVALITTAVCAIALTFSIAGCKRGKAGESPTEQVSEQQQRALQELLKYAQETGQTLDELRQSFAKWKAAQSTSAGPSSIRTDIAVLSALVAEASKAVEQHNAEAALSLLRRMSRVARALLSELPGQQIAVRVERALLNLRDEQPDVEAASRFLLQALDACLNASEATLVPDVASELEAAKSSLPSNPAAARSKLIAVLDRCGKDQVAVWAYYIVEGLDNAFEALGRKAWPVVAAELSQVKNLIQKINQAVTGQVVEEGQPQAPAEEKPAGEAQPSTTSQAAPEAEAPAAQPPAQSTQPQPPAPPPSQPTPKPEKPQAPQQPG